jgi:hypothetical protein
MVRKIKCQDFERFIHSEPSEHESGLFGMLFICLCVCVRTDVCLC